MRPWAGVPPQEENKQRQPQRLTRAAGSGSSSCGQLDSLWLSLPAGTCREGCSDSIGLFLAQGPPGVSRLPRDGPVVQPEALAGREATARPVPSPSLALTLSGPGLGALLVAHSPLCPQVHCLGTTAGLGNTGGQKQGLLEMRSRKLTACSQSRRQPGGARTGGFSVRREFPRTAAASSGQNKFILRRSGSQNPQIKASAGWFLLEAPGENASHLFRVPGLQAFIPGPSNLSSVAPSLCV